ncbi:MAG: glycosyltransferase [bacterium]|nr:glycosyltransferase [bacterium]
MTNESPIKLSYITATKNKLPYLRAGLEKVIAQKKPGEEILVADGNSSDGTKEYLAGLKADGKIDFFISEADFGESHALNKLFLAAKGTLIKIINDDDAYYFPAIEACKKFMLDHPEIDILGMEGGSIKHRSPSELYVCQVAGYKDGYMRWQKDRTPFDSSVLGLMLRRSSLPVLGFWNHSFTMADTEFTFRVTAGKASIAWYTGSAYVYIKNQDGVTWVRRNRVANEIARLRKFYLNENPPTYPIKKLKQFKRFLLKIYSRLSGHASSDFPMEWLKMVELSEKWLEEKSVEERPKFLF